jgi:hypothetical protein
MEGKLITCKNYLLHKLEQEAASDPQTSSAPVNGLHCYIISNQQFQAN